MAATAENTHPKLCAGSPNGRHDWVVRGECMACGLRPGTLINLTPHAVNIHGEDCQGGIAILTIRPFGMVARVAQDVTQAGRREESLEDVGYVTFPVSRVSYGQVVGLPGYRLLHHLTHDHADAISPEHVYIVSRQVALHPSMAGRIDLAYPGASVRDGAGQVVGVTGLYSLESTPEQQKAAWDAAPWA